MDEFPILGAHFNVSVLIFFCHERAYTTSVRVTLGTEKKNAYVLHQEMYTIYLIVHPSRMEPRKRSVGHLKDRAVPIAHVMPGCIPRSLSVNDRDEAIARAHAVLRARECKRTRTRLAFKAFAAPKGGSRDNSWSNRDDCKTHIHHVQTHTRKGRFTY